MTAQTSDRVSRIAAQRSKTSTAEIRAIVADGGHALTLLAQDIRALAGSALRQDETKGPAPSRFINRLLGR